MKTHSFSEHHQRDIRTMFQYIDKLLSEVEHTMADAGSQSPFRTHSDDTTPIQRKGTHDYVMRIREAMRRVMEGIGNPAVQAALRRGWTAAINLMFCSISLNELTPERMRAYGPLSGTRNRAKAGRTIVRCDGYWKCALFTLEVKNDGAAKRDPNNYIDKRSAKERPGGYGRELL